MTSNLTKLTNELLHNLGRPMLKDVKVFQLKKDNHVVTFRLDGEAMEVGVGFVGENHKFDSWPIEQARNMWKDRVYEGYRVFP